MNGVSRAQAWGGAVLLGLACAGLLPLWWHMPGLAAVWWQLLALCTGGATQ